MFFFSLHLHVLHVRIIYNNNDNGQSWICFSFFLLFGSCAFFHKCRMYLVITCIVQCILWTVSLMFNSTNLFIRYSIFLKDFQEVTTAKTRSAFKKTTIHLIIIFRDYSSMHLIYSLLPRSDTFVHNIRLYGILLLS